MFENMRNLISCNKMRKVAIKSKLSKQRNVDMCPW